VIVRVGCVPDLRLQRLQSFLGGLYASDPELEIDVSHLRSADQVAPLRDGALDLGLVHAACHGEPIETTPVFEGDPLAAFLPAGHGLTGRRTLGPADLVEEVLVVAGRSGDRDAQDAVMQRLVGAGYEFREVRETGGSDVRDVLFAVAEGRGVALLPAKVGGAVGELGDVVTRRELDPAPSMPDTLLAWSATPRPELGGVIDLARGLAQELYRPAETA
jgi:DNA-binding transcriptional LysR family regulator